MQADATVTDPSVATLEAVKRFDEAFNRRDVDAVMAAMTDDCVFESTSPAPDGGRYQGQAAVRAAWKDFFQSSPDATFQTEELFVVDDRCTARWVYHYTNQDGVAGHIRGVDVFRVREGKVAEKFSYVKG